MDDGTARTLSVRYNIHGFPGYAVYNVVYARRSTPHRLRPVLQWDGQNRIKRSARCVVPTYDHTQNHDAILPGSDLERGLWLIDTLPFPTTIMLYLMRLVTDHSSSGAE
jgi:hypothetical protein